MRVGLIRSLTLVFCCITTPAFALSTVDDIVHNRIIPLESQPVVGPSHEIPPGHWSYQLIRKLQIETGTTDPAVTLDGEKAINRTEMAVLLSSLQGQIKHMEDRLSEREKTQFEILQEEFQAEMKVLQARIHMVETSVQHLAEKVDQQLLSGTTAEKRLPAPPTVYGALHMWSTVCSEEAPMEDAFRLRRANIGIRGDLNPHWHYNVMIDPARSRNLLKDLWLDYTGIPHHTVRIGQMKPGTTFDSLRSSSRNLAIDRSMIGALGNAREQNAALLGEWKALDYQVGIYNGEGENQPDLNRRVSLGGRVTVRPLRGLVAEEKWGRLEVGGSVFQEVGASRESDLPARKMLGVEARYLHRRFELNAEALRFDDPRAGTGSGWYVESAYNLTPRWQLLARYDTMEAESRLLHSHITEYLAGLNYLLQKPNVRIGLNYVYRQDAVSGLGGSGVSLLVQHVF